MGARAGAAGLQDGRGPRKVGRRGAGGRREEAGSEMQGRAPGKPRDTREKKAVGISATQPAGLVRGQHRARGLCRASAATGDARARAAADRPPHARRVRWLVAKGTRGTPSAVVLIVCSRANEFFL